jgi:hypothetical protein
MNTKMMKIGFNSNGMIAIAIVALLKGNLSGLERAIIP